MEKGSLDFTNLDSLGRSEMKQIMAGSGGNIYCNFGGQQQWQCQLPTLTECTEACVAFTEAIGSYCEGCAQFP